MAKENVTFPVTVAFGSDGPMSNLFVACDDASAPDADYATRGNNKILHATIDLENRDDLFEIARGNPGLVSRIFEAGLELGVRQAEEFRRRDLFILPAMS